MGTRALAVLASLFFTAAAWATTTSPKDVTCPVCEKPFTALVVGSSNTFGGIDLDLCSHAAGEEPRTLRVWTCPSCRYSNWAWQFEKGVKPETKKRILDGLPAPVPIAKGCSQRDIPGWVKYRLAATVKEWEGADAEKLARLQLEGAWVSRNDVQEVSSLLQGDESFMAIVEQAWQSAEPRPIAGLEGLDRCLRSLRTAKILTTGLPNQEPERSLRLLQAAVLLRYRGENSEAEPMLATLAEAEDAPAPLRECVGPLRASIERERTFQEAYLRHQATALAKGLYEDRRRACEVYIGADTLRRLGRKEEAAKVYLVALGTPAGPPWLADLVKEGLRRVGAGTSAEKEIEEVRRKRTADALKKLTDPETADLAYRDLRAVVDPEAIPAIVAALGHENSVVRAYAALTLKFYGDPGPEAVDALVHVMLDDPEEYPREKATYALKCIASPRSREAFEKLLKEGDPRAEDAVEALGMMGESSTVPLLLAVYEKHRRDVEVALSRLTNREFESMESFREWWDGNRKLPRKDWVVAGFEAAGRKIGDPAARESVPLLIDALEDGRFWIRMNALRALRDSTGQRFGWDLICRPYDSERARARRAPGIARWRTWWSGQD